jgi:hypothetical protein
LPEEIPERVEKNSIRFSFEELDPYGAIGLSRKRELTSFSKIAGCVNLSSTFLLPGLQEAGDRLQPVR